MRTEPPNSAGTRAPVAPRPAVRFVDRARTWVIVPIAIGAFLLFSALFGGVWWLTGLHSDSPVTGAQNEFVAVNFHIGGAVSCLAGNWTFPPTPCSNLTQRSVTGHLALLYAGLPAILTALAVATIGLGALVMVGTLRLSRRRIQVVIELALIGALAVASIGVPVASALAGPPEPASTTCYYLSGNNTTCPTFWGSGGTIEIPGECDVCKNSIRWGAGDAFYQTVAAGVFFAASAVVLWVRRRQPFTPEEEAAWATRYRPLGTPEPAGTPSNVPAGPARTSSVPVPTPGVTRPTPSAPSDPRRAAGRYVMPSGPWTCASCGTENLQWSNLCRSCGADRPIETAADSTAAWDPKRAG